MGITYDSNLMDKAYAVQDAVNEMVKAVGQAAQGKVVVPIVGDVSFNDVQKDKLTVEYLADLAEAIKLLASMPTE